MALLTGSPAIAAGAAINGVTTDQRGSTRPATPDIGAFQTLPVASLAVSTPATAIAGVAFPVTITAEDQYGNPVTNYSGSVTLTSSDKQTVYLSAAAINLINGTATVMVTLESAEHRDADGRVRDVHGHQRLHRRQPGGGFLRHQCPGHGDGRDLVQRHHHGRGSLRRTRSPATTVPSRSPAAMARPSWACPRPSP